MPGVQARLNGALAELAAPRTLPELRQRAVEVVAELVTCTIASWNEIDIESGQFDVVTQPPPEIDPGPPTQRMLALLDQHPVIAHIRGTGDGRPHAISDFIDERTFRASDLYREVYADIDTLDQLSITLPDPHLLIGVALNRSTWGFAAQERQVLNLLRPHLTHAHRNALAFERLTRALRALEQRSAVGGESMMVLDSHGRVEYSSPGADELLADWFGADDRPSDSLPGELRRSLQPLADEAPHTPTVISRDGRTLTIEQLVLPTPGSRALLLTATRSAPVRLQELGLTPRQAEVLTLAADGLRDAAIGAQLGISPRTVEKHLQMAYERLGTPGRVAAVRLVHRITAPPFLA